MRMDSARAENQLLGYLEVGQAACQQAQYLYLPRGQFVRIGYRCCGYVARGPDRGWCLSLRDQGLLRRHHSSLAPGGSKGSLAKPGTSSRDRAFIVSLLDKRNRYAARLTQDF